MSKKIEQLLKYAQSAHRSGNREQAQRSYEKVLAKDPRHLDARYLLGTLLAEEGRYAPAQQHLEYACRLAPDSPYIRNNLGNVYLLSGQDAAAEECFRKALQLRPDMSEALTNLGNLVVKRGLLEEAIALAERARALRPEHPAAHVMLANALKDQGRIDEAIPHYCRATQLASGSEVSQSNLMMALNYAPDLAAGEVRDAHLTWGQRFAAAAPRPAAARTGRLRIGYLSPDLGRHPVGYLIAPVLAAHDHERFEIFVYSDTPLADDMTAALHPHADTWRDLAGKSNDEAAAIIATDGIDVLVELAGHSAGNRLAMLARRVAPVQVSYLGYPATTGLPTMDYVISDHGLDPAEADAALYSEKLWRLDRPCFAFRPDEEFPPLAPLPVGTRGALCFGSFNALAKISDAVIDLWAQVLHALPDATLLMQARAFVDAGSRQRVSERFRDKGVAPERIEMLGLSSLAEHLAQFNRVDVCLDTFPWNGHMTTLDSLWMGVPVLTLAGDRRAARMGETILRAVGLAQFVATSPEDFVARARALAGNVDELAQLRASMRERLAGSALADGVSLARALESAYAAMHQAALQSTGADFSRLSS